jgi:hypothetical protein
MTKTNKYSITVSNVTYSAQTKSNLVIEMARNMIDIDTAESLVKEEFMTDRQRVAITKKANTQSIKTQATKLQFARKLNATLNSKNGIAWNKARELYTIKFDIDTDNMSNKAIEKAIKALIADIVVLEGFEA